MDDNSQDKALVTECLAGSQTAWNTFYSRFVGLMRSVVRKHGNFASHEVEDIVQAAFLSLATALKNYDAAQSLPRFVCLITDRVLIDEYRKGRAAKRDGEVEIPGDAESVDSMLSAVPCPCDLQDERMEKAETAARLKEALEGLDGRCRRLITLRFIDELSFKEIAAAVDQSENTVTVQTRRCLDALRAKFLHSGRRGRTP